MTSMTPRRAWRLDLAACLLLLGGAAAAASILTYDPLDAPGAVSPPRDRSNLLGLPGTLLADALVSALGTSVWAFLLAWASLALLLFLRKRWVRWSHRAFGW